MYKQINRKMIAFMSPERCVGKTASAWATAVGLREINGRRPLAVDLDERGDLTRAFGVDISSGPTIREVLSGEATINEAIRRTPLGDIIPAGRPFTEEMKGGRPPVSLKDALDALEGENDIIVADAPVRYMDDQISSVADSFVVPFRLDEFDADEFKGSPFLLGVSPFLSEDLRFLIEKPIVMLPIICDPASSKGRKAMRELAAATHRRFWHDWVADPRLRVFKKYIRECPELPELMASRANIFNTPTASSIASDYAWLVQRLDGVTDERDYLKLKMPMRYKLAYWMLLPRIGREKILCGPVLQ